MLSSDICDEELLYRFNKKSYPNTWINNRPSPALFMDPAGLSTQRDGGREELLIIGSNLKRFIRDPLSGIVKVIVADCRNIKVVPKAINNKKDPYHAEIHNSDNDMDKEISFTKAVMLADCCSIVYYDC